jgi:transcription initiation factor TFIIIB Brf1 subunit/transcription initiation factor TFIIB
VPTSKKAKRIYFANRRANWLALIREAAQVTNLTETTLRQYARVARHCVQVEGLSFGHHIEALRARTMQYVSCR